MIRGFNLRTLTPQWSLRSLRKHQQLRINEEDELKSSQLLWTPQSTYDLVGKFIHWVRLTESQKDTGLSQSQLRSPAKTISPSSSLPPSAWWITEVWRGILLCCSPKGFFPFFPVKGCFGVFPDPMSGQRSGMSICTEALWGTFVICENGLYKIHWIELSLDRRCVGDCNALFEADGGR